MKFPNIYDNDFRLKCKKLLDVKFDFGVSEMDSTGYSSMESIVKNFGVMPLNNLQNPGDFDDDEVCDKELEPISPQRTFGFDYADASNILKKIDDESAGKVNSYINDIKKSMY